jgi:hypothetical protein
VADQVVPHVGMVGCPVGPPLLPNLHCKSAQLKNGICVFRILSRLVRFDI